MVGDATCESTGGEESEGETAEGAGEAAAALVEAVLARGKSEVLLRLICGASDADLALNIASALGVGPEKGCKHLDKEAFLAPQPLRAALLTHLIERRDVGTCARVARRLGLEMELASSPRLAHMVYIYAYTYINMCTFIYAYIYMCIYIHIYICIHIHM